MDCRNRYLPMDFNIDVGIASFEVYVRYNAMPSTEKYDKVFYDDKIRLPAEDQKHIRNDFSIRFMVLAISEIQGTLSVQFHGVRNKVFIRSLPKFDRIKYDDFTKMKLYIPGRIEFKKELHKVSENKRNAYIHNPSYREILSSNRARAFDQKQKRVLMKRKALQVQDKKRRKANLDKFIKRKRMVRSILWLILLTFIRK